MKHRLLGLSLALTLTLSLTPALAAGTADKFPAKNTWAGFSDVASDHWAAGPIKVCYETGLMNGKGAGFDPDGEVTVAEAVALAARLGSALTGTAIPTPAGADWFVGPSQYVHALATQAGDTAVTALLAQPTENATRADFFSMLALTVPQSALGAKNSITTLPDTDDQDVLRFYNAGVLTGVNAYGTFVEGKGLSRAEMAAMISRVARPETAVTFAPKPVEDDTDLVDYYLGVKGDTPAITGKNFTVTMREFLTAYVEAGNELVALCQEQNTPFSWNLGFDDGSGFPAVAKTRATSICLNALWADVDASPYTAQVLGAKHILVATKAEADDLLAQLKTAGDSKAKFDELMNQYSTDGGLQTNPNGYTFGPGTMIEEFENGTKALSIGQISAPIEGPYGWHIILRIAPDPEELKTVAYQLWQQAQKFLYSDAVLESNLTFFYDSL